MENNPTDDTREQGQSHSMKRNSLLVIVILLNSMSFILLKLAGMGVVKSYFHPLINLYFLAAILVQGIIFILWQVLLRDNPISAIYPFMSLVYVIVPIAAHFIFREQLQMKYLPGVFFIVLGVVLINSGSKNA